MDVDSLNELVELVRDFCACRSMLRKLNKAKKSEMQVNFKKQLVSDLWIIVLVPPLRMIDKTARLNRGNLHAVEFARFCAEIPRKARRNACFFAR